MKMNIPDISIEEYNYHLPEDCIARYPGKTRDESKLLVYQNREITDDLFYKLSGYLPSESVLIFNDTKVIRARLFFHKETGARIELFCLEPAAYHGDYQVAFTQQGSVSWKCIVGNSKKWKSGVLVRHVESNGTSIKVRAERMENLGNESVVKLSWQPGELSFSEVMEVMGEIPLPPYLKRNAEQSDRDRYQTVYARKKGSVAAPTAGLHFTPRVFESLRQSKIPIDYVTLHVSAGTFKPVSASTIEGHEMHHEQIILHRELPDRLITYLDKQIIPVGTTSIRTLESIYWFGVRLANGYAGNELFIDQWDPYREWDRKPPVKEALEMVGNFMDKKKTEILTGETRLMIVPGYEFKLVDGMITNFHLPKSTLLLLIAAYLGDDWKKAYHYALDHDFRFLSYGDSCFFYRKK